MPRVEIRILGGFAVRAGGAPIDVPGRKVQALLARLARRPGEEVSRAALAAMLWPDRGEEQARGSLRQALATLRRTLGEGAVRAGADVVALDRTVASDAAAFDASSDTTGSTPSAPG
jgi:DNA-binding SARP family transcriptional activator